MRLIKNFLHNINDIALAIIIVLIAAGIIYWRMQVILDYPKTMVEQQMVTEETQAEPAQDETAPAEAAPDEEAAAETPAEEAPEEEAPAENAE